MSKARLAFKRPRIQPSTTRDVMLMFSRVVQTGLHPHFSAALMPAPTIAMSKVTKIQTLERSPHPNALQFEPLQDH